MTAQAKVGYKQFGSTEYTFLDNVYTLNGAVTHIDLSGIGNGNIISVNVIYGNEVDGKFTEGVGRYFTGGSGIDVTGKLNQKAKATDKRGEVIGIRNTAKITAIDEGKKKYENQAGSDINVEAKATYPWIFLSKTIVEQNGNATAGI